MQKSTPKIKYHHGFTLIEIMIVLVIIAVMSGVVTLKITSLNYSGFMGQGLKVASELEIIADEAVYTNSVIACDVNNNGLVCQSYKDGDWQDLDLLRLISWAWPKDMQIKTVYINGRPLKDNEKIRFYPNGDIPPMSFQITNGVYSAWVDGSMDGTFAVNN